MAKDTWKLTTAQVKDLASTLRPLAKKITVRDRSGKPGARRAEPGVESSEVLVLVLGPDDAVMTRTRVSRRPDQRALEKVLLGANVAADRLDQPGVGPSPPLTRAETSLLDEAGLVDAPGGTEQFDRTQVEYDLLMRESLSLAVAARDLKVGQSRLRQRLSPRVRTLYGVKDGERAWRIPRFQFAQKGRLVRNIDKVIPRIRPDAHPLVVYRWFAEPHQDLVAADGQAPMTPLAWLDAGLAYSAVGDLATEI